MTRRAGGRAGPGGCSKRCRGRPPRVRGVPTGDRRAGGAGRGSPTGHAARGGRGAALNGDVGRGPLQRPGGRRAAAGWPAGGGSGGPAGGGVAMAGGGKVDGRDGRDWARWT